jgi:hypothetical protein
VRGQRGCRRLNKKVQKCQRGLVVSARGLRNRPRCDFAGEPNEIGGNAVEKQHRDPVARPEISAVQQRNALGLRLRAISRQFNDTLFGIRITRCSSRLANSRSINASTYRADRERS